MQPKEFNRSLMKREALARILEIRRKHRVHAPDFPAGFHWLNAPPLSLSDLKGKIVLLDFWTYGCINCLHVLPDLKFLEEKYARKPLVVIGIHAAKFDNEKDRDNIQEAILRQEIAHPVIVDEGHTLWDAYAVRVWPTLVLIDPQGYVIGRFSGQGNREILDVYIEAMLEIYGRERLLDYEPVRTDPEANYQYAQPLCYPGKVLADEAGQRLFIADTSHHRILVTGFDGSVLAVIGAGRAALKDGDFAAAAFRYPRGLVLAGERLLVADTGNHAIRAIDFAAGTVQTLAGTGRQAPRGQERWMRHGRKGSAVSLNSPWDVWVQNGMAYIPMAGAHQIWQMDLQTCVVALLAGSGREGRQDGSFREAAFAQPCGITGDGANHLFVADSESSCVRRLDLQRKQVDTLAGGDLFAFGDRDGVGDEVRLQHPLGISFYEGNIYLADTYNHKIKILDPATGACRTLLGSERGMSDGPAPTFYEPGGLSAARAGLFVADTNNHLIHRCDLHGQGSRHLKISGLGAAIHRGRHVAMLCTGPFTEEISLPLQRLAAHAAGRLRVRIHLPDGHLFSSGSPFQYVLRSAPQVLGSPGSNEIQSGERALETLVIPWQSGERGQKGQLVLELQYYYCSLAKGGRCARRCVIYKIPVATGVSGKREIIIEEGAPRLYK